MNPASSDYEASGAYSSFYDSQYIYQHQAPLPSPPSSPRFSWQVTTIDEDAHTHTYNDKIPSAKARRTQIPPETMATLMTGPDPKDGKYVCLYGGCMRRFGRKYNIQSHIQTHLADRPFRCNVCAAGFVRRHDLVRHARIHGTGKDFVCGCGKGFSRMDALNRHRQRQICVGGADRSETLKSRKRNAADSSPNPASSSIESDAGESYSGHSDSRSCTPELLHAQQFNAAATQAFSYGLELPADLETQQLPMQPYYELQPSPAILDYAQEQPALSFARQPPVKIQVQRERPQQHEMIPRYAAPTPRYHYQLPTSPHKPLLDHGLWVDPSLISPAMTASSQFQSDSEDQRQYYY